MTSLRHKLEALASTGNLRHIPEVSNPLPLDLSSNDYLGFALEAETLEEEFLASMQGRPLLFTSAASRLLSTRQEAHHALEHSLEHAYGKSVLLFNSGYHANLGCIGALAALPDTVFLADKLVHASIIDGLRLSGATFHRFRHNDMRSLRKLLERHTAPTHLTVIVTESIFSMDGDSAPLSEMAAMKQEFPSVALYVDEAHAFGVAGPRGLGMCAQPELSGAVDITVGTFGKAAASSGAFVVSSADMKEWMINTSRSFIFSTALPPVNASWSHFMLGKIMEADNRRRQLATLGKRFREGVECLTGHPTGSSSQIIPLLTGDAEKALALSSRLRKRGILALPIRRPTVPPGTERIRFSLHASLTSSALETAISILEEEYMRK